VKKLHKCSKVKYVTAERSSAATETYQNVPYHYSGKQMWPLSQNMIS